MAIEPDLKNWTWVLERSCNECGFNPASVEPGALPKRIRDATQTMHAALHDADVRDRPDPTTWSKLEYGAHVRDVCTTMRERLELVLAEDDPVFQNWDQDATAIERSYSEADPARVAIELDLAAALMASAFEAVLPEAWSRPARRSTGDAFTVLTLGVYALHDLDHHVWDVTRERA